jgi:hypothetical protein
VLFTAVEFMSKVSRSFLIWVGGCLAVSGVARGATLRQMSMDQMSQSATAIVRARVASSSASLEGSTIYTHYKLEVGETWKGSPPSEVMLPGGVASGYRQSFPGVPQLQIGSEYVLFLWTSSAGITHVIGLSQGIFNLNGQKDGSVQATRPLIGEAMLDSAGHTVPDQAIRMDLGSLRMRVRQNINSGAAQ